MRGDVERATYLGMAMIVGNAAVVVLCPETGKPIAKVPSVSQARRFIKGYRNA